ncbi:GRF1-interacting factor 1-like protein [Tanacetum coccineum]|uniref:GRF1-interacting factor 1-like protein n=1 Tax=Tanacetum coccineum TaxID=301880 RepID=A0ABQ4ZEP7_9ASTR
MLLSFLHICGALLRIKNRFGLNGYIHINLRGVLYGTFLFEIGNGQRTSTWYDNWSPLGQLSNVISNRDIYSAGFKLDMRVSDIIKDGMWAWPTDWLIKYPMISNMNAPVLTGSDDYIVLRNHSNMDVRFSVATIWDCIRPRNAEVNWFHIVWFSQRIPRHAIHLWLVVNRKLKTQDLLRQWDVKNSGITMFNCPLCEGEPDSHNHLFFGCRKEIKDGECSKDPSDLEVARVAYLIVFSVLMEKMGKGVSNTAEVADEKDSKKEEMSRKEYEKVLQEKRKALVSLKSGE